MTCIITPPWRLYATRKEKGEVEIRIAKKSRTTSVYASYSQRICRLVTCKEPFKPARKDQIFCKPLHRQEYWNDVFKAGRQIIAKKERQERMKGVRAVTNNMTSKERLAALVETAQVVLGRQLRPISPIDTTQEK